MIVVWIVREIYLGGAIIRSWGLTGHSQGCPWGPWPRRWIVSPTEIGHMGDAFHSATWNQRGLWGPEGDMWCLEESQIQNANLEGHGIQAVAGWGRPRKHEVRTPIVKRQDWGQEATKRTEKDRPEGQKQFPMANKKPRNENVLKRKRSRKTLQNSPVGCRQSVHWT